MKERTMKHPGKPVWKRIAAITGILLLMAAAGYYMLFHVNRFSLEVRLAGESEMVVEYGGQYEEPGAGAVLYGTLFWKDGVDAPKADIQIQNDVQQDKPGKYTVSYTAQLEWLTASACRTVRVVDTQCPVITLVDTKEDLPAGVPYEEDGFYATDNFDGDITDRVVRHESYGMIGYTVMDSSGNPAYAQREIPFYDPVPPVIELVEGENISIAAGTIFKDPGFSAVDTVDGDLTDLVEVSGEVIWYRPGIYELSYTVCDAFQNRRTVIRQVEVEAQERPQIRQPEGKVIYLTFDDGPGPYTHALLDVLEKYNVKATFFVTDTGYYEEMKRIVDQGHSIGIHSVTHDYHEIYASPEAYFSDLHKMREIIFEQTGVMTSLVRFPGGSSNTVSCFNEGIMSTLTEAVRDAGFQYFDWNVDSDDAGAATAARTVLRNVLDGISNHPVSVVLQHDIQPFSVAAVEDIILWALDNGYRFEPLQPDSPGFHHGVRN